MKKRGAGAPKLKKQDPKTNKKRGPKNKKAGTHK